MLKIINQNTSLDNDAIEYTDNGKTHTSQKEAKKKI